jgi:hypothetical protein
MTDISPAVPAHQHRALMTDPYYCERRLRVRQRVSRIVRIHMPLGDASMDINGKCLHDIERPAEAGERRQQSA